MPVMRNAYRGAGPAERFRPVAQGGQLGTAPVQADAARPFATVSDQEPIQALVLRFLRQSRMAASTLGLRAADDHTLIPRIKNGSTPHPNTEARLRRFIREWTPDEPVRKGLIRPSEAAALLAEVREWCRARSKAVSWLGRQVGQDGGSFTEKLEDGRISPVTAQRLRAFMADCQ